MKPFKASEFISNEETPVVGRNGKSVEIVTLTGRGERPVIGYVGDSEETSTWYSHGQVMLAQNMEDPVDLFFAPKVEVVHVFKSKLTNRVAVALEKHDIEFWMKQTGFTHLGTITGPIVPPENSEVAK